MVVNRFGGAWTEAKLRCVEEYLAAWLNVMKSQSFTKRYIDAFSGSGHFAPKGAGAIATDVESEAGEAFMEGSALRALQAEPPFDRFDFIELNAAKATALDAKVEEAGRGAAKVHREDVNIALPKLCAGFQRQDRAVAFLDPFGAQVDWTTVEAVATTEKIDLWYLLPVSIINRLISKKEHRYSEAWAKRLTACLGTDEWKTAFFKPDPQGNLFGAESEVRSAGVEKVERYFVERLSSIFPKVSSECLRLVTPDNTHLFSLCFAVSNPSPKAIGPAMRIANHLIKSGNEQNGR